MTLRPAKSPTVPDYCIIGVLTLAAIYAYAGFFHPDPYILSYGTKTVKILWVIRIGFPLLYGSLVLLYAGLRSGKIDRSAVVLMGVTGIVSLSAGYTIADSYYQHWFDSHRPEYHPYLQLMPSTPDTLVAHAPGE